jgi:N-acyl-D-aspartate/D-glutamate deacylase
MSRRIDLRVRLSMVVLAALGGFVCLHALPLQTGYDLVILGGRVLDGTGGPAIAADVAIRDGRIAAVGPLAKAASRHVVLARGKLVTPGFIDVHSHAAEGLVREGLEQGRPLIAQGITTIIANPDGGGPVDLEAQRATLEARGLGPNVGLLIGHGSVRTAVMGREARAPDGPELARMEALVDRAMQAGAFGLSSGLFYTPGAFAKTDELVALARRVAPFGGVYTSHIRDEGNYDAGLLASVDEVIQVAEQGGVIGIVSHMKALGPDTWGKGAEAADRIEGARTRGVRVFADQYPYEASSTSLQAAVIPVWARVPRAERAAKFQDPAGRQKLADEVRENIRRRGGAGSLQVAQYAPDRTLEGQKLDAIAAARGMAPELAAIDLVDRGPVSVVSFNMADRDIFDIMRRPWTMTSSDGGLVMENEGVPHPRNYGAFARKLAVYVRERRVISIERAVHSMTGLSAEVFGLADRGRLVAGAAADVLIFDPEAVRDRATYTQPHQLSEGMSWVFVNGVAVLEDGKWTETRPGRVLKRRAAL